MRRLLWVLMAAVAMSPSLRAEGDDAAGKRAAEVLLADDLNGDGKVAADEWMEENEKFLKIDKDGDGFLTQGELAEYYANAPADDGGKPAAGDGKPAEGDGKPPAEGDDGKAKDRMKHMLDERWKEADKDGDGFLSKEEWTYGEDAFKKADADTDGKVSRDEMGTYLKGLKDDPKALAEMRFKSMDTDKDGKISKEEWKGPEEMFGKADKDADGFLSLEELAASMQRPRDKIAAKLKEMDKDGDGAVSREEWTGPGQLFDRLDKDGDGKVTAEELKAMGKDRGPGRGGEADGK